MLDYEKSVVPTAIVVHETLSPGAVVKVTQVPLWGKEQVLWQGTDPTPAGSGAGTHVAFHDTGKPVSLATTPLCEGPRQCGQFCDCASRVAVVS